MRDDVKRRQLPLLLEASKTTLPLGASRKEILELLAQMLVAALATTPSGQPEVARDEDA